jgi:hypothetical protein
VNGYETHRHFRAEHRSSGNNIDRSGAEGACLGTTDGSIRGIAALAGIPELRAVFPMAGPMTLDARLAEKSPMGIGGVRLRFIRLTRIDGRVEAAAYVWWHGQPGPNDSQESSVRRCTEPRESVPLCIVPVPLPLDMKRDWEPVLDKLLTAKVCDSGRATDQYELRAEVFTRGSSGPLGFRAYEVCNPIASEFRALFDELAPNTYMVPGRR